MENNSHIVQQQRESMKEITRSEIDLEMFCSYIEKAPKPLIPQSIVSQTRTGFLFHQLQGTICPNTVGCVPGKQDPYTLTRFEWITFDKESPKNTPKKISSEVSAERLSIIIPHIIQYHIHLDSGAL